MLWSMNLNNNDYVDRVEEGSGESTVSRESGRMNRRPSSNRQVMLVGDQINSNANNNIMNLEYQM